MSAPPPRMGGIMRAGRARSRTGACPGGWARTGRRRGRPCAGRSRGGARATGGGSPWTAWCRRAGSARTGRPPRPRSPPTCTRPGWRTAARGRTAAPSQPQHHAQQTDVAFRGSTGLRPRPRPEESYILAPPTKNGRSRRYLLHSQCFRLLITVDRFLSATDFTFLFWLRRSDRTD